MHQMEIRIGCRGNLAKRRPLPVGKDGDCASEKLPKEFRQRSESDARE